MTPAVLAAFLFELQGVPVGLVELSRDGDAYTYRSRQWFARGATMDRRETIRLGAGPRPESLWFYEKPLAGCVQVRGELTGELKQACADRVEGNAVRGRIGADAFEARYQGARLAELKIGAARFDRVAPGVMPKTPPDLFDQGFPIHGTYGPLRLEPAVDGAVASGAVSEMEAARKLAATLRDAVDGDCVAHAKRFLEQSPGAVMVLGLVEDGGRAWPHAWVRVGMLALDPTLNQSVTPERYLAFGADPGRIYLDLLAGSRRVVRSP